MPTTEIGSDPAVIRDYLQAIEGLGFSHILMLDHVLGIDPGDSRLIGPYTYEHPFHEPLTFLAWAAGQTSRIELITGILVLPQRQAALVAKQATEVDILSGGRLRLGVGVGWNKPEYAALAQDFHTRGRRLDTQIDLIRRLWSEELVLHKDQWHDVAAGINPRPRRRIPIWLGGMSEPAMRRAARLGDGWLPHFDPDEESGELRTAVRSGRASQDDLRGGESVIGAMRYEGGELATDVLARLLQYRREAGSENEPFVLHGGMSISKRTTGDSVGWTLKWDAIGMDYLSVDTMYAGKKMKEQLELLRRYAEAMPGPRRQDNH